MARMFREAQIVARQRTEAHAVDLEQEGPAVAGNEPVRFAIPERVVEVDLAIGSPHVPRIVDEHERVVGPRVVFGALEHACEDPRVRLASERLQRACERAADRLRNRAQRKRRIAETVHRRFGKDHEPRPGGGRFARERLDHSKVCALVSTDRNLSERQFRRHRCAVRHYLHACPLRNVPSGDNSAATYRSGLAAGTFAR